MHDFRMLGGIRLTREDGAEVDALLRQPKRIAVLAFLALPAPGTWHRRDTLLLTFWPDLDQARARASLRSSLYALRQHLPDGAIRTRGDEEVGLDPAMFTTDVASLLECAAAGRLQEAVDNYRGDFLAALHVPDAAIFEHWIEKERTRLKGVAVKAAIALSQSFAQNGEHADAAAAAQRAVDLDPFDESAERLLIAQLDRSGDRAKALLAYERFRDLLARELGATPASATVALVEDLRRQSIPASEREDLSEPAKREQIATALEKARPFVTAQTQRSSSWLSHQGWRMALATGAAILMIGSAVAAMKGRGDASPAMNHTRLVIAGLTSNGPQSSLDSSNAALVNGLRERLTGIGNLVVRPITRRESQLSSANTAIHQQLQADLVITTRILSVGDSLELRSSIIWPDSSQPLELATRRFVEADLREAESKLAASIVGVLYRTPMRGGRGDSTREMKTESAQLMTEGWHAMLELKQPLVAREIFKRATDVDPNNAGAWSGLSSAWTLLSIHDQVPFDEGYLVAETTARRALSLDSTQGSALASLALLATRKHARLSAGDDLMRKAKRLDPSNPEVFIIQRFIYEHARMWDKAQDASRIAAELEPSLSRNLARTGTIEMCAGRFEDALQILRDGFRVQPNDTVAFPAFIRVLALLGRYDEALDAWRSELSGEKDPDVLGALSRARGAEGYWEARHAEGRRALNTVLRDTTPGWKSPLRAMRAHFMAGDTATGFRLLEKMADEKNYAIYKMECMNPFDEYRNTARYKAIVERVGALGG